MADSYTGKMDSYTGRTGPFTINVVSDEPVKFVDNFGFVSYEDFNSYTIYMWVGNDMFSIDIDDYSHALNLSENTLLDTAYLTHPELEKKDVSWIIVMKLKNLTNKLSY